jgi:formate--tetrahydrofolate ligase
VAKADLGSENVSAVEKGCPNLGRHIENVKSFGVPVVVAINHFHSDTPAEVQAVKDYVAALGTEAILCHHWAEGSKGISALATRVAELADSEVAQFAPIYADDMPLFEKIETIARRIYRADEVLADAKIRNQLKEWEAAGYGHLPICMAKTQYSFTTDPALRGAPDNHSVPVREVRLAAGAGFIVVICGEIMTMPGLPRKPAAQSIRFNDEGLIEGLF